MNRGCRKSRQSSSPAADHSFYDGSETRGISSDGSASNCSHASYKPFVVQNVRLYNGSPQFQSPSELPNSGNKQDQAPQQRTGISETGAPFDICNVKAAIGIQLKTPLLLKNRQKRDENKRSTEGPDIKVLRPGMLHLRHYVSVADQVRIIETCRKLGQGPGGFCQPFYRDGVGKLHLKMRIRMKVKKV